MINLFGNSNNDDTENCPASGWTVRPSATRRDGDRKAKWCPAGDHKVSTKDVRGGVQLGRHRR